MRTIRIKGYTVHQADANGKALCGVLNPEGFMGNVAQPVSADIFFYGDSK